MPKKTIKKTKAVKLKVTKTPVGFPNDVQLMGQRWQVKYVDNVPKDIEEELGDDLLGVCLGSTNHLIFISTKQGREAMVNTLLHELLHAYVSMFLSFYSKEDQETLEAAGEQMADMFSLFAIDMLRNVTPFWEVK